MINTEPFIAASIQAAPVYMHKDRTVEKACDLIAEAGKHGAKLAVFPEAFIPAYPDWVWNVPGHKRSLLDDLYAELLVNAVSVPDRATEQLCRAAKQAKMHVVMGINERNTGASNASLFNSLLYIDHTGDIIGLHRKLVPTSGERLVWMGGDGSTLEVYDTPFGKLGGLICWENYMPLARYAMYSLGTQVYVAPTWDRGDLWLSTLRHIAKEGGVFVIGCCMALHINDIPERFEFRGFYPENTTWINQGDSCIVNPRGEIIAGPAQEVEDILYAEIDIQGVYHAKRMLDVAGHYARPDVFRLTVNRQPLPLIQDFTPDPE